MRSLPSILALWFPLLALAAPGEPYSFVWRGAPCRGSEIHRTIARNDLSGLNRVLQENGDLDAPLVVDHGDDPRLVIGALEFAVERGWWEGVQALLADDRIDPNARNRGIPPIQAAVLNQKVEGDSYPVEIALALARHPRTRINDIHGADRISEPLLLTLARLGRHDVVQALQSTGHRFNALAFRRAFVLAPYEISDRSLRHFAIGNLKQWSRQNFLFPRLARACGGLVYDLREFLRPPIPE